MSVPKQVEEAAELAEQLIERLNQPHSQEVEVEESEEEAAPSDTSDTDEAAQPDEEELTFKERYKSLKGKYEAEVPKLHADLRELKQTIFDRLEKLAVKEPVVEEPVVNERMAKFREEYGDEYVENLRELFKTEFDPLIRERVSPIEQKLQESEASKIELAQKNFTDYLDTKVDADWRSLWAGNDPKFNEFLQQPDPSGLYTYGELCNIYNDKWDADKLARVFKIYIGEKPEPVKEKLPNPTKDAMVAPSRSTTTVTPAADNKTVWTQELFTEFQKNDRMGKYDEATSKLMWDDLLTAVNEGRLRL